MKNAFVGICVIGSVLGTSFVGEATAADMPLKARPAVPITGTWEGFYLGVYGGGVFGDERTGRNDTSQIVSNNTSGATFGGLIGINHQWNALVLGLEGDGGWTGASHTVSFVSATSGLPEAEKDKSSYSAHIRARAGLPFGQFLPFVAGGVSFTNDTMTLTHLTGVLPPATIDQGLIGWNIGGGVDYAFTSHWIGRVEYIYDQFGKQTLGFDAATAGQFSDRIVNLSESTVRAALSYKF